VPESILLAVSYNVSRWETHGGAPSFAGGYGPMHLTQVSAGQLSSKGDDAGRVSRPDPNDPALHTLDAAAQLLGVGPDTLKHDPAQNIRGGAVLLAQYAHDTVGMLPASVADCLAPSPSTAVRKRPPSRLTSPILCTAPSNKEYRA
jgi:hypothetical protein